MPRRSSQQREEDLVQISDLYLRGYTMYQIGQLVGVTATQISNDLHLIRSRWRETYSRTFNSYVEEQLAKIDKVEYEAWEAWLRSKQPKQKVVRKSIVEEIAEGITTSPESGEYEEIITTEQHVGDPQFLQIIGACVERRCKILGIDATDKFTDNKRELREPALSEQDRVASLLALFELATKADSQPGADGENNMGPTKR